MRFACRGSGCWAVRSEMRCCSLSQEEAALSLELTTMSLCSMRMASQARNVIAEPIPRSLGPVNLRDQMFSYFSCFSIYRLAVVMFRRLDFHITPYTLHHFVLADRHG